MMNLTLRGSQINLSKQSNSSGRTTARTFDKLNSTKSNAQTPREREVDSSILHTPETDEMRLNLADLDADESAAGQAEKSSDAMSRSQKNVSNWLNTHANDSVAEWDQLEIASLDEPSGEFVVANHQSKSNLRNDPELRVFLDSLDMTREEAEHSSDPSQPREQLSPRLMGFPDDTSDNYSGPPACLVRPASNSINSRPRSASVRDPEESDRQGPTSSVVSENHAARVIQKFWRRHKQRKRAAQAAIRRMLSEQKHRLEHLTPTGGMPMRAVLIQHREEKRKNCLEQHRRTVKALQDKRQNTEIGVNDEEEIEKDDSHESSQNKMRRKKNSVGDTKMRNNNALLQKPASPIITPRYSNGKQRRASTKQPFVDQFHRTRHQTENASDDDTLIQTDEDSPSRIGPERGDAFDGSEQTPVPDNHSEEDERRGRESNGRLEYTNYNKNSLATPRSWNGEADEAQNRGWSEMLTEIHRVLADSEEGDSLGHSQVASSSNRGYSSTMDPVRFHSLTEQKRGILQKTNTPKSHSGMSAPVKLTRENLHRHSNLLIKQQDRSHARTALEQSVINSRAYLNTMTASSGALDTNVKKLNGGSQRHQSQSDLINSARHLSSRPSLQSGKMRMTGSAHPAIPTGEVSLQASSRSRNTEYPMHMGNRVEVPSEEQLTVQSLAMQLEERTQSVQRLQRTLEHQRELSLRQLHDTQLEAEKRQESMKTDYEATVARNYKLIDELIEEKKALHAKCESLMTELKTVSEKADKRVKQADERYKVDLRKTEAKLVAAQKLRQEKWEAENSKRMKEMTVRGMESEIAQLIASHKAELRQLRQTCTETVQAADARAFQSYTSQIEELRQALVREKEEACSRERETANQRLEKTLQDERAALELQRRRLLSEVADERERLALTASREREEAEKQKRSIEDASSNANEKHRERLEELRDDLTRQHQKEIEELQRRTVIETEAWEEHTKSVLEAQYLARENSLRDQLKKERDRQLEAAVRRLESDANQGKEEADREAELKIRRIREKSGAEISELERSEKQAMEKYCEMKTKLLDKEHESDRMRIQLQQKEEEMTEIKSLYEKLNKERKNMSDIVRQEFADRLVSVEEENRSVKRNLAEFKARLAAEQERHHIEVTAMKKANATELESLHQKIKETIRRKDEKLVVTRERFENELKLREDEIVAANRQTELVEDLLNEQRQQFLQNNPHGN